MKNLFNIIVNAAAGHAPIGKLFRKEKETKSKPRIAKGLLISIKTKNLLYFQCYNKKKHI